jgi:hypothetical protein
MVRTELIKRSPLRLLDKAIHGGLGKGNVGVLASRKGVGKTACLVHIATDKLFQNKPVIHVSYSSRVDHIITWYEDIFKEIAKKRQLESAVEVHDEIIKNRVIMNFKQDGAKTDQVLMSVESMIKYGNFPADSVIVDGYDFLHASPEDFKKFHDFAGRLDVEVWFSASLKGEEPLFDERGLPRELSEFFPEMNVCISLYYKNEHVTLNVCKDRDHTPPGELDLKLDPATMLIAE